MAEEIVGEIRDEYDQDEEDDVKEVAPDEYLMNGSTKLDDLNDRLGLELESEDYDSIGGPGDRPLWTICRRIRREVDYENLQDLK